MRWYEIQMRAGNMTDSLETNIIHLPGFGMWDFEKGIEIKQWPTDAWYKATEPGIPDDALCTTNVVPVYSKRFREALSEAGIKGIQYLPVQVFYPDGSSAGDYAIANILNLVSALDKEKSEFLVYGKGFQEHIQGQIKYISKPVLKAAEIEKYDVIRLEEHTGPIFVSERFRKVFKSNKFTGIGFTEVGVE